MPSAGPRARILAVSIHTTLPRSDDSVLHDRDSPVYICIGFCKKSETSFRYGTSSHLQESSGKSTALLVNILRPCTRKLYSLLLAATHISSISTSSANNG